MYLLQFVSIEIKTTVIVSFIEKENYCYNVMILSMHSF
jgi:hypothetical protein